MVSRVCYFVNWRVISLPVSRSRCTSYADQEFAISWWPSSRTNVQESCPSLSSPRGGNAAHATDPSLRLLVMLAV